METDSDLWRRAMAGDRDAFAELFDLHHEAVYNYLFRRTADWSVAEDLTSSVFLELWRTCRKSRVEEGKVLAWFYGVATNVVRNQWRSQRRHRAALERLPHAVAATDFTDESAARIDDARRARLILNELKRLSRPERDVVALSIFTALTHEEISVALGVPVGTVKSRLARVRTRLDRQPRCQPGGDLHPEGSA